MTQGEEPDLVEAVELRKKVFAFAVVLGAWVLRLQVCARVVSSAATYARRRGLCCYRLVVTAAVPLAYALAGREGGASQVAESEILEVVARQPDLLSRAGKAQEGHNLALVVYDAASLVMVLLGCQIRFRRATRASACRPARGPAGSTPCRHRGCPAAEKSAVNALRLRRTILMASWARGLDCCTCRDVPTSNDASRRYGGERVCCAARTRVCLFFSSESAWAPGQLTRVHALLSARKPARAFESGGAAPPLVRVRCLLPHPRRVSHD
jgi:hypothetical protein